MTDYEELDGLIQALAAPRCATNSACLQNLFRDLLARLIFLSPLGGSQKQPNDSTRSLRRGSAFSACFIVFAEGTPHGVD